MDENGSRAIKTGVTMDNKKILDIGSIISDINLGAASKFSKFFPEKNQVEVTIQEAQEYEYKDQEPIGDYNVIFQELRNLLDNIKEKWGSNEIDRNLFNKYYQKDLLYIYDRIELDMNYLDGYPERNNEWLEKLLELKYEIRNLL